MKKFRSWFSEWGNRFYNSDGEKRTNRFVNYAYVSFGALVILLLAAYAFVKHFSIVHAWLDRGVLYEADWHVYTVHGTAIAMVCGMLVLKNSLGYRVMANGIMYVFALAFSCYLGYLYPAGAATYLVVIGLLLFPCSLWHMQKRGLSIFQIIVGLAFLVVVAWYSRAHQPALQIPAVLEPVLFSVCALYLVFVCLAFAYYFVSSAGRSERQFNFERKLREKLLTTMIPELQRSEKRYSHLVEDAADIIFSLNEQFEFKMVNRTMKKILQYDPTAMIGKKLSSLVVSHGDDDLDRQLLEENLNAVMSNKETRDFRIGFKGKHNIEPVTMRVSLSYSESEGQCEILGKASLLTEDKLNEFLESERATYILDNSLLNAEDLSRQLTRHLQKCLTGPDLTTLRVALREMLVNAIEHGNLNVTFDEKTQAQLEGRYLEFIRERMEDEKYSQRRVRVEYVFKPALVAFRITDEGGGFDHNLYVKEEADHPHEALEHGRGIKMSRNAFDRVQYLQPGNKVILIKKFLTG